MPSTTRPSVDQLIANSSCYKCIPTGMQNEVIIYLLNSILGTNLTPQQLMDAAVSYQSTSFNCIPAGMQNEVIIYLLDQLV